MHRYPARLRGPAASRPAIASLALLLALIVAADVAIAGSGDWLTPRLELGGLAGIMYYDHQRGLNGDVFGGRLGLNMTPRLGVEGVLATSRASSPTGTGGDVRVWVSHVDMMLNILPGRFTPYVSGGLGNLTSSDAKDLTSQDKLHFDAGTGLRCWLSDRMALRADLRTYWTRADGMAAGGDSYFRDVMATAGLSTGFGAAATRIVDTDLDGIQDKSDRCPDTPLGVAVDAFGCPADTDRDGVPDYRDQCPSTTLHVWVDRNGCPTDEDADGVADGIDRCLETPAGAEVDGRGCPRDSDGDGVYDGIDLCAKTPSGTEVDEGGCPKVKEIERRLVLHSVTFASGSAQLLPSSYVALDDVAESLRAYPGVRVEIGGYADSMGSETLNLTLTQQRAEAVREYLVAQGVSAEQLRARGYGEASPVAPNDTAEGRAMNRRVEFRRLD